MGSRKGRLNGGPLSGPPRGVSAQPGRSGHDSPVTYQARHNRLGGRALASLVVGVGAISTAAVLVRLCEAPPLAVAAYRLGIAALVLVVVGAFRGSGPAGWRAAGWCAVAGGLLAVHFAAWIASLALTTVAASVVLVTMNPLFVAVVSWWWLGEPPDRRTAVGIAAGLAGAFLIGWGDFGSGREFLAGDLLALLGAAAMSGYLLVGRRVQALLDTRTYVTRVYSVAAALLAAAAALRGELLGPYPARTYGYFLLLALIPQLLGHTAINHALRHLTAPRVAAVILGEPVGSTLLAWAVLGEVPRPSTWLGGALVLGGILLVCWPVRSGEAAGDPAARC